MKFIARLFCAILSAFIISIGIVNNASAEVYEEEEKAVELLNQLRISQGLQPLEWDPDSNLQIAANIRAEEQEKLFSHTRPDGSDCFSVLKECHIRYTHCGENIAMGTDVDAEKVIDMWTNSPGHYQNMVDPNFHKVGLAYWLGSDERTVYWVQLFTN